jgi:predicted GIY-YIG superfamily endonuclease
MEYIYILELKSNKYYIGKTQNVENRFQQHINGKGSSWTKKYKPISILKFFKNTSNFDEDKYVKEYMAKYGIENVRGGSYSKIDLDYSSYITLQKELWHSKNLCTRCGRNNHFVKNCYAKTDINGNIISNESSENETSEEESSEEEYEIWCCEFCNKEFNNKYQCEKHEEKYCKNRPCDICGKKRHREINCWYV